MNKLIAAVAVTTLSMFSVPSYAADLPARHMPVKAMPVEAVYSWTGFYFGVHAGYAWGELTSATLATVDHSPTGGMFGGQIGYNWQQGSLVFGVEADISYAPIKGDDSGVVPGPFTFIGESKMDVFGTVRGRLGFTWDRALIYGTGGYAWSKGRASMQVVGVGSDSQSLDLSGWTVGGGIEYAFTQNITMRAEYLYVDFSDKELLMNIGGFPFREVADKNLNIVRVGLNFKM